VRASTLPLETARGTSAAVQPRMAAPRAGPGGDEASATSFAADASLARQVWSLAWPAITHMFLITLVFLMNRVMVGRYSGTALASMQISGTLVWSVYSVFTAFSAGTLAVVARSIGAGDRRAAAAAAHGSLLLALGLGVAVMLPFLAADGALLRLLFPRAGPEVIADADAYLRIVLPVLPLSFVEAIAAAALQGSGDTRTPLYVATAGNLVNVSLSALLIFGHWGMPELGVRGAAIGAAATLSLEGILLLAVLLSRRSPIPLRERLRAGFDRLALRRVLRVSVPTFAEKVVYHSGYLAYVAICGLLGAAAMAANQALISIEAICFLSADGFGIAAAAVVAQKLGARRVDEATRSAWYAAAMAVALLTTCGLVFAVVPRLLMSPFTGDPAIVDLGARSLYAAAAAQPFMAFATVMGMSLRGAGDTRTVLAVTVVCSVVVRLAATWIFAMTLGFGLVGVWMGSTADWMLRSLLLGVAWMRGRWRAVEV
jgi:putative MATE family efflux protein